VRERSYEDNATPAANGVAIANLVRLALALEDLAYLDRAEQSLQSFSSVMGSSPQSCPSLFAALDWFQHYTLVRTQELELRSMYLPTTVFRLEAELPEGAIGLVCQGLSCREPARSLAQMREQILASGIRTE
jgi:uncharacterized protein